MVQDFEDFLPRMAEKLGAEGLISKLCIGFRILMDPTTMLITSESLKRKGEALGLKGTSDEDAAAMVSERDLDGDGALNQMEFCVPMVRLSPGLMEQSWSLLNFQGKIKESASGRERRIPRRPEPEVIIKNSSRFGTTIPLQFRQRVPP